MERKLVFIKYVSFNMLSMVGLSCYILADTLFIANGVGSIGLTALNLILPLYSIISGLGLLIGVGSATRFSILKVQQRDQEASAYFTTAMKLGFLISIPITILGFVFAKQIMYFMGADFEVIEIASTYLRTFILFTPFFIIQQIIVTFVRNDNNPRLASFAMLTGTLFNIVFDYILVFPCQLGMFGAALATGFSPIVALCICSLHVLWKQNHFHFTNVRLKIYYIWKIITIGISTFVTELSGGIIVFVFNMVILSIGGNIAVASYGIISNLALVVTALYTGIAQGIQPLLSQSHGQRNTELTHAYFGYAIVTSLIVSTMIYVCMLCFPQFIVAIFNSENNMTMAQIAQNGLPLYFAGFFFAGINMVMITFFASTEQMKKSFVLSILRGGVIIIPLVIGLSILFHLNGVWISFPISECFILIIAIQFYYRSHKTLYQKTSVN